MLYRLVYTAYALITDVASCASVKFRDDLDFSLPPRLPQSLMWSHGPITRRPTRPMPALVLKCNYCWTGVSIRVQRRCVLEVLIPRHLFLRVMVGSNAHVVTWTICGRAGSSDRREIFAIRMWLWSFCSMGDTGKIWSACYTTYLGLPV